MNKLLKDLKVERVQGSNAVLNYSNFDYWVNWDDIVEIIENREQPKLNENQQVVLEWLKEAHEWMSPFALFRELSRIYSGAPENVLCAVQQLDRDQQFQVLSAFADWGMKNE